VASKQKLSRHKFAGRNNGPSRQRYWASNRLEQHKVKALMLYNGLSRAEAVVLWNRTRTGRRK
jgi:hypothetical protein